MSAAELLHMFPSTEDRTGDFQRAQPAFSIQEWFALGMKRELPALIPPRHPIVNLGPGYSPLPAAENLDYPAYDATIDQIPHEDGSVGTIFASHFLEHFEGHTVIRLLGDIQRVLVVGGTANIVVPYYSSQLQAQDLTHRSEFCEETWKTLFNNSSYRILGAPAEWHFRVQLFPDRDLRTESRAIYPARADRPGGPSTRSPGLCPAARGCPFLTSPEVPERAGIKSESDFAFRARIPVLV